MLQGVQVRAVPAPFSHLYPYRVGRLPQVLTPARPSPKAISRKPIGILLTLLNATLTRTLDSKRLTALLSPLDATLTENQGGPTPPSIETHAASTCLQANLFRFGECGPPLELRGSI